MATISIGTDAARLGHAVRLGYPIHGRAVSYVIIGLICAGLAVTTGAFPDWRSDATLHTALEVVASAMAIVVGALGFARYAAQRNCVTLMFAAAFLGVGILDAVHAAIVSPYSLARWPQDVALILAPWSGAVSRCYLAIMLIAIWVVWHHGQRTGILPRPNAPLVFGICGGAVAATIAFVMYGAPALGLQFGTVFSGPQSLAVGVIFTVAIIAHLHKGQWRTNHFEHWLVIALIFSIATQVLFAFGSRHPFDAGFDAGHVAKVLAFVCVFVGSTFDIHASFDKERRSAVALQHEARAREGVLAELTTSREQYRELYENAPNAYVSADAESNRILQFNRKLPELTGFEPGELLGMTVAELYDDGGVPEQLAQRVGRGEIVDGFEIQIRRKDGQLRWVRLTVAPFCGADGTIVERRAIVVDIEERKQFEASLAARSTALERSNAELQSFASIASHDLQEPLRKIRTFGDRLAERHSDGLGPDGAEYLGRIRGAAERMQVLISDLLTYSRVTTQANPFGPVDLNGVVAAVIADLEVHIEESGARIMVGPMPTIDGDASQLGQLFQNLVGNALKYRRPEVAPEITILAEDAGDAVTISVTDNGIGIDDKNKLKIFEVFQRLHGRDQFEGTGIGLALCRKITDRHQGTIAADGVAGHGTTFTVKLPKQQSVVA